MAFYPFTTKLFIPKGVAPNRQYAGLPEIVGSAVFAAPYVGVGEQPIVGGLYAAPTRK